MIIIIKKIIEISIKYQKKRPIEKRWWDGEGGRVVEGKRGRIEDS